MGNIRDERLYRTFQQKKVQFMKPVGSESDKWFNIFVLHQNRAHHSQKSCIHEVMIDTMFDLVIWGHEHECRINPEPSSVAPFHIIQPGSSVATSLSEGESRRKHVGILEIKDDHWRINPVPINSVRPFVMKDIQLASHANEIDIQNEQKVSDFLAKCVLDIIEDIKKEFNPKVLPLIRIRVDVTGGVRIHPARFGQLFVGKVANPKEILLFQKKKVATSSSSRNNNSTHIMEDTSFPESLRDLDETTVGEIIRSLLTNKDKSLEFFPESEISEALTDFVDKNSKSAFSDTITKWLKETYELVRETDTVTPENDIIRDFIKQRTLKLNESYHARVLEEKQSQSESQSQTENDNHSLPNNDSLMVDSKENVKLEKLNEDDFRDDENNDGFLQDYNPTSPKFDSPVTVKKEKKKAKTPRKSPATVKKEKNTTPKTTSKKRSMFDIFFLFFFSFKF